MVVGPTYTVPAFKVTATAIIDSSFLYSLSACHLVPTMTATKESYEEPIGADSPASEGPAAIKGILHPVPSILIDNGVVFSRVGLFSKGEHSPIDGVSKQASQCRGNPNISAPGLPAQVIEAASDGSYPLALKAKAIDHPYCICGLWVDSQGFIA